MEPVDEFGQTQKIIQQKGHSTFGMNCLLLLINVLHWLLGWWVVFFCT